MTVKKVPNRLGTRNFYIMATSEKIIEYITKNRQASGRELSTYLPEITPRAIRKQLKNLLERQVLKKLDGLRKFII